MRFIQIFQIILPLLIIIGNVYIITFLLHAVIFRKRLKIKFVDENALLFAWAVSFFAMLGSLFYSEILGYAPCQYCWYQRIFMYPQVFLLGTAFFRKFKNIFYYLLPLSIVGLCIAIYQYIMQMIPVSATCSIDGGTACHIKAVFEYGYITIPFMALTGFVLIIIFTYIYKRS